MNRSLGNNAITTAILGRRAGEFKQVHIDASKSCPCCDVENKVIYSPFFGNVINREDDMMVRGYNEHEAGHARFTPPGWIQKYKTGVERNLCNCLEDERIEKGVGALYPIFAEDLRHLNNKAVAKLGGQLREHPLTNPIDEAVMALHIQSGGRACDWEISAPARRLMDLARDAYARGAEATCDKAGVEIIDKAVAEIVEIWKRELDTWPESENEGEGIDNPFAPKSGEGKKSSGKGGESKSGQGKGDSSGESEGEDGEQGQDGESSGSESSEQGEGEKSGKGGESSGKDGKSKQGEGEKSGKSESSDGEDGEGGESSGKGGKSKRGEDDKSGKSESSKAPAMNGCRGRRLLEAATDQNALEKARQNILQALGEKCHTSYVPYEDEDVVETPEPAPTEFRAIDRLANSVSSRLQSALEDTLRSMSRKRKRHHREDGELDDMAMVDICKSLSDDIFYDLGKSLSLKDTKVMLLLDESGSMSGSRIRMAGALAVAFGNVLDSIGVPFSVVGHTTKGIRSTKAQDLKSKGFVRVEPLLIREYKDFEGNWIAERERLGKIANHDLEQNVDSDAVKYCCKQLLAQDCDRRVLLVLSDGYPACEYTGCTKLSHDLKDTIRDFREAGVEIVGIGISTESVKEFYGEEFSVNVDKLDNLSEEFFTTMEHTLIQGQEV